MGVLTGNNIRGQAELKHHTPTIKGYWANKSGQKISKTSFGSTVRLYIEEWTEYIRLKPVNVKIYIKSNASGKESLVADGQVKQLVNSRLVETTWYIEKQLSSQKEYGFLDTDATQGFALVCVVSNGFGFLYDNEMIASIEVGKPCFCNRDFTVEELYDIIIQLRKKEKTTYMKKEIDEDGHIFKSVYEVTKEKDRDKLFSLNYHEIMVENEGSKENFTIHLNEQFRNYEINTCIRKLHFLTQAYIETQRFTKTYETNPAGNIFGGKNYRGRGLLHLTHDYNYRDCYIAMYGVKPIPKQLEDFATKIATSMKIACQSSCCYWHKAKSNKYADEDNVRKVSASVNNPSAVNNTTGIINDMNGRKQAYELLIKIMRYEECTNKQ